MHSVEFLISKRVYYYHIFWNLFYHYRYSQNIIHLQWNYKVNKYWCLEVTLETCWRRHYWGCQACCMYWCLKSAVQSRTVSTTSETSHHIMLLREREISEWADEQTGPTARYIIWWVRRRWTKNYEEYCMLSIFYASFNEQLKSLLSLCIQCNACIKVLNGFQEKYDIWYLHFIRIILKKAYIAGGNYWVLSKKVSKGAFSTVTFLTFHSHLNHITKTFDFWHVHANIPH